MSKHLIAVVSVLAATLGAFLPVLENEFVNWDDPFALVNNPRLAAPGIVAWAFTTTHMGHYQPVSWLVWSQAKALAGPAPSVFHALSLVGHLLNGVLVYFVGFRLASLASVDARLARGAAVVAALVFAVHPLRVEVVAWASAFPYVLSLGLLLLSLLAYLSACAAIAGRSRAGWLTLSMAAYAVSQLARASAVAFPFVLLALDAYPLRRSQRSGARTAARSWSRLVAEKLPFFAIALAVTVAESRARELTPLHEVGAGARLTMAATAPFVYLGRTLLPTRLTPLDPLPIEARVAAVPLVLGAAALATITFAAWKARRRWPSLALAWIAYLLLLAPVAGLTPSGQQATADRYMYLPGVVVSLLVGLVAATSFERLDLVARRKIGTVAAIVVLGAAVTLGVITSRQATWWHDSVRLWTRAAELDPHNDIATYNLAIALAESGREEEAIARYEQTLRLVPDHEFARHNVNLIRASQAEREGDRLAQAGNLDAAIDRYAAALAADSTRLHARAARGLALVRRTRFAEAAADLRIAFNTAVRPAGVATTHGQRSTDDVAVANALTFALAQTGNHAEAAAVLRLALARYPEDHELAHNLARLLATTPDRAVSDAPLALRLALAVRDRTGGRDPRVLDTLAAAYAANAQFELARDTANQAARLAKTLGEMEMAREAEARARAYGQRRVPNARR